MSQIDRDKRNFIDPQKFPRLETLQVKVPSTFMRRAARPSSAAETELVFGTYFHIHKRGRGWVWGQSDSQLPGSSYPGYVGWVKTSHLDETQGKPTHLVAVLTAPVFKTANIKSPVVTHLSMGSAVNGENSDGFASGAGGFIHGAHLRLISAKPVKQDWVTIAESLIGLPYIWGGVSGFGLDCSGLVQTALRMSGGDAPRDSGQQAEIGSEVEITPEFKGLKRGDLVFWKGHVGVMQDSTRLLHANAYHMKVASEPLKTAVQRIKKNAGPVTGIRRL